MVYKQTYKDLRSKTLNSSKNIFDNDIFLNMFGNKDTELLDSYWKRSEIKEYSELVARIKSSGKKILRNSDGKHKII